MPRETGGVLHYIKAKGLIEVNFPSDDVNCHQCPFFSYSNTYERGYCCITKDDSAMSKRYAMNNINPNCPLEFEEVS